MVSGGLTVLILVVVEDVLVHIFSSLRVYAGKVLILVVVEDVLVQQQKVTKVCSSHVLILVVVEDVLVLTIDGLDGVRTISLNPCCGGRCSST